MDTNKYKEFKYISKQLNNLDIIPLLYGSLGLEQQLKIDLYPDDIDILIPKIWLNKNWQDLRFIMNKNGYYLFDKHEHSFKKNYIIAFAPIEQFIDKFTVNNISQKIEDNCKFYELSLEDYLKVYNKFMDDEYRINKKDRDQEKIKLIEMSLNKKEKYYG